MATVKLILSPLSRCVDWLGIVVICNFVDFNICQPVMVLKNFAHLGSDGANVTLVETTQMERASEVVNFSKGDITLIP